jgi:hypothetical protein
VARRIIDSITPGWKQIGAVWLPLPHLINALPVQVDAFYRSGAFAIAVSIVAFTLGAGALTWMVMRATGSPLAATAGAALFVLNPNILYLQATPMTEPLLIGLTMTGVALLYSWMVDRRPRAATAAAIALALACLTRYEAWPITAAAITIAMLVRLKEGAPVRETLAAGCRIAMWPASAIVLFMLLSRATVGEWLVTGGFFVADNPAQGRPVSVATEVLDGVRRLAGAGMLAAFLAGSIFVVWRVFRGSTRAVNGLLLAPVAAAALPAYAFFNGHPFRIRYMVPLVAASALLAGVAIGLLRRPRWRTTAAAVLVGATLAEVPPADGSAAMLREAKWDVPYSAARRRVTDCLVDGRDGRKILVSMGSLAHYMQEASRAGFALRDFVHEGNGTFWSESLVRPDRHVGWILIEERAEGGDMLAARARTVPEFLAAFDRVCEGGGMALYRYRGTKASVAN